MEDISEWEEWRVRVLDAVKQDGRKWKRLCVDAKLGPTFLRDLFERGQVPTVENLRKLCDELGLSMENLFAQEPKSSEDIAHEMQKTAMGRAFNEARQLAPNVQRLILDTLKGQIQIAKAQQAEPPPAKPQRERLRKTG